MDEVLQKYFKIIDEKLDNLKIDINKLFEKNDCIKEKVIEHDTKISILWKFTIGSIFGGITAIIGAIINFVLR